jgi:hypothetical protein
MVVIAGMAMTRLDYVQKLRSRFHSPSVGKVSVIMEAVLEWLVSVVSRTH